MLQNLEEDPHQGHQGAEEDRESQAHGINQVFEMALQDVASDLHQGHQGFGEDPEDLAQKDEEDSGQDHFGLKNFCHFCDY